MENKGLLFIPDISGFTQFVSRTDIEHSRLIIQELLELLINNNQLGLEVSEIEGDAILFYKFGDSPGIDELYKQVEKMFCAFHQQLKVYDVRKFCQCEACLSAINLTLKVITHYGEFAGYSVKSFNKLIGKDVIVAHQLLKNDIPQHEYWLVTKDLLHDDNPDAPAKGMKWNSSAKQTETGEVLFHYTQLSKLKENLSQEFIPPIDLSKRFKALVLQEQYETDIITLFHAVGDFRYRGQWKDGVKSVEELTHFLPRVGMKCRYIMEGGESVVYSSSYSFSYERIEFSEEEEHKKEVAFYLLEKIDAGKTMLTISYYIENSFRSRLSFNLLRKKKMEKSLRRSLNNLHAVAKAIHLG